MADWPATLPNLQLLGLTEQRQDSRVRSTEEKGPIKMRRRFSASVTVHIPIILTGLERRIFDTFYIQTLEEGALQFTWESPTTDEVVSFRFQEPPEWTMLKGGRPDVRLWQAALALMIMS